MRRSTRHISNIASVYLFLASAVSGATTRNVDQASCSVQDCRNNPSTPCCLSGTCCTTTACCTIQQGIDAASDADTVSVKPGTYGQITFYDNLGHGRMITVKSTDGRDKTTIGSTQAACVKFDCLNESCAAGTQTLDGFRVSGATTEAGISCQSASPVIKNCEITGNGSLGASSGGGMNLTSSNPTIQDSVICSNRALAGGGIYSTDTRGLTVQNCLIEQNTATVTSGTPNGQGGGMAVSYPLTANGENVTISHCIFSDNTTDLRGGAISTPANGLVAGGTCDNNHKGTMNIDNSLFDNNQSTHGQGGAIYKGSCSTLTADHITTTENHADDSQNGYGGAIWFSVGSGFSSMTITDSILWGDTSAHGNEIYNFSGAVTVTTSDVQGGYTGTGNLSPAQDPLFYDTIKDNFHIKNTSPAKDHGSGCASSSTDLDGTGHSRCKNGTEDMGAYEAADCASDSDCVDAHGCSTTCNTTYGVCVWPDPVDCNCNGIPDWCDISKDTSSDCNNNGVPDECDSGGPFNAVVVTSVPANNHTLWRDQKNIARITFACDLGLTPPTTSQVTINELLNGGSFGSNLAPSNFTYTIENDGSGHPRILKIQESASTLQHRTWYGVKGSWSGVASFEVDYQDQRGDADDNNNVQNADAGTVNGQIPCLSGCGDARRADINGDLQITSADTGIVNSYVVSLSVTKPSGH